MTTIEPIMDANKKARTANLSVKVVSAALNAALRQGYIQTNPATAVEALTAGLQKVSAELEVRKAAPQTVLNNR